MKKTIVKIILCSVFLFAASSALAEVRVHINIPLPPPLIFPAPPHVVVIPDTNVYVVPDIRDDIFFYGGWWWRPWNGRWYRSRYYDRGWTFYHRSPFFYQTIPPGWRDYYRNKDWKGQRWEYRRIPPHELQRHWNQWKRDQYWERQQWGVQGRKHKGPAPQYKGKPHPKPSPGPRPGHSPR